MSMENNDKQNQGSSFWWGLIVGAAIAGLVVLLLDKEDKENLRENIKGDWEKILEKIKELVGEKRNETGIETETGWESAVESKTIVKKVSPPKADNSKPRKFFKKSGRILH